MSFVPVLAHNGGWDEILMVAVPLLVFAGLLFLARRRAEAMVQAREAHEEALASGEGDRATE